MCATSLENATLNWLVPIVRKFKRCAASTPKCFALTLLIGFAMATLSGAEARSGAAGSKLAFLSQQPAEDAATSGPSASPAPSPPPSQPHQDNTGRDNTGFDGKWTFTGAGCPNSGSVPAVIRHGRIIVRGGSGFVEPDGTLHSVGAGGGMTLTAVGSLTGNTGSGTFNRSDGCIGSWIAIKR
jgi:hypothetical protein